MQTREQLYKMLKTAKPELAIGKSRARREELQRLLGSTIKSVTAYRAPAPTPALVRLMRGAEKAPLAITPEQAERFRRAVGLTEAAKVVVEASGLTIDNYANIVSVASGVPVEQAKQVLNTFFNLKTVFTAKRSVA